MSPQSTPPMPLGAASPRLHQPFLSTPGLDVASGSSRHPPPHVIHPGHWHNQAAHPSQQQFNNTPVGNFPQAQVSNLVPIGFVNGAWIYHYQDNTAPVVGNDPPVSCPPPKKRKIYRQPDPENMPYVKKPPNAFMIYRKEQRPKVVAEMGKSDCASVNRLIGQRWTSMSNDEQKEYYKEADKEMQIHNDRFPEWTAADNYGKKRKRIRRKGPSETEETDT